MKTLLAILLGLHLRNCPPGLSPWRFLWRGFVINTFYRHRRLCDDEMGCTLLCRRWKKLKQWEEKDDKTAFPKARIYASSSR